MYAASVILASFLMAVSAVDYVRRAWKRETDPALATFILLEVVFGLSLAMYMDSPRKSWTANIAVVSGLGNVTYILVGLVVLNARRGTLRVAFDRWQKRCMAAGAVIAFFWVLSRQPLLSYSLVQFMALIALFATVKKLWSAERCTEPLFLWVVVFAATLTALYPAWVKGDTFAWIYLARAVPSTAFMVLLIRKVQKRQAVLSGLEAQQPQGSARGGQC